MQEFSGCLIRESNSVKILKIRISYIAGKRILRAFTIFESMHWFSIWLDCGAPRLEGLSVSTAWRSNEPPGRGSGSMLTQDNSLFGIPAI